MDRSPPLLALLLLSACSAARPPPRTLDTRCGLDCEAQARYGLQVDRCFEYSDDPGLAQDLPSLGVQVLAPVALETGGMALPVRYTQGGLLKMTDYFRFDDMDLLLARRAVPPDRSLAYLAADGSSGGVTWVTGGAGAGTTLTTHASALFNDGQHPLSHEHVAFTVAVASAEAVRQKVPAGTFPDALLLTFSEEPQHGADILRVFAPGVGFLRMDTRLNLDTAADGASYYLQAVRDLVPGQECGAGVEP